MRCNEIAPYLEDLLDGERDEANSPVHDHLATCPECRRRLEWLSASRAAFRSLPPERPRNGFDRRLAERIAVETGAEILPPRGESWRRPLTAWKQRPALQWALAASLLIAVLGGSLFLKGPLSGPSLPPPASGPVAQETAPAPAPRLAPGPAPVAPERRAEPRPSGEEPPAATVRTARRAEPRPALRNEPTPPPPAPEPFAEEDRMAGLEAPPVLGYVQAQDLPVSYRCQLDGNQDGCSARIAAQVECQGFGECGGPAHADELIADATNFAEAAAMGY